MEFFIFFFLTEITGEYRMAHLVGYLVQKKGLQSN